jgi:hypothetical protein
MLKFLKRLLTLALLLLVVAIAWVAFGLWSGMYGVYSYPASKGKDDGRTLLISRDAGERTWNSPNAPKPVPKKVEKGGGLQLGTVQKPPSPVEGRIIIEFPYVEWAYRKSLIPVTPDPE